MPELTVGQPKPPPGWYPDQQSQSLRWWDGQQWTNHRAPIQGNPSSFPQAAFPQTTFESPSPVSNYQSTHSQDQVDFHHFLSDDQSVRGASSSSQVRAPKGRPGPWLIIAGLIAVVFLVIFLVGTAIGVLKAMGLQTSSPGGGFAGLVISPLMSVALAYFLFRLSSRYFGHHPSGPVEGSRLHQRTLTIGAALVAVATLGFTMYQLEVSGRTPTLTGPELQEVLRDYLGERSNNPQALTNTISCPKSRQYGDGDVARCSINLTDGSQMILEATLYRTDGSWRVNLGFG
ncbi:hypothetical protein B2J88_01815 [Rhodococcus sp. SRB_17]|nr:hypothetical protein [Rhodococcus sp. SRB_17]